MVVFKIGYKLPPTHRRHNSAQRENKKITPHLGNGMLDLSRLAGTCMTSLYLCSQVTPQSLDGRMFFNPVDKNKSTCSVLTATSRSHAYEYFPPHAFWEL